MKIPVRRHQAEIEHKKSRFIAIATRITTAEEIKTQIALTRKEHPQANHVVHAAVFGLDGAQFSLSDDHEPKNTAGRPALEILKGSGITNILVMIVRYFGGTLLGTGGLVKAYGEATKAVLAGLEVEQIETRYAFHLVVRYGLYDQVKLLLAAHHAGISEEFDTVVTVSGTIAATESAALAQEISNLSSGTCVLEIL